MSDSGDKRQFNVRMPIELIDFLKHEAKTNHRTVVNQLVYILEREKGRVNKTQ